MFIILVLIYFLFSAVITIALILPSTVFFSNRYQCSVQHGGELTCLLVEVLLRGEQEVSTW